MATKRDQHHNNFINDWLGDIQIARNFFQEYLPNSTKKGIKWGTLRQSDSDFAMKALKNRKGDFLFECELSKNSALFYIHLEHQRAPNKEMPMRMMIYQTGIWIQFKKQYPNRKEPLIFPMVLYHGKEPWDVVPDLHQYLDVSEDMKAFTPNFQYYLLDLSHLDDNQIKGELLLRVMLLTMKHINSPSVGDYFNNILYPMIPELLEKKTGLEYLETILYYLTKATNKQETEMIIEKIQNLPEPYPAEEIIMTILERCIQEGRQKGILEGEKTGGQKTAASMAWNLLKSKFPNNAKSYYSTLKKMSVPELNTIGIRLLNATKIEQVFQENEEDKKS